MMYIRIALAAIWFICAVAIPDNTPLITFLWLFGSGIWVISAILAYYEDRERESGPGGISSHVCDNHLIIENMRFCSKCFKYQRERHNE